MKFDTSELTAFAADLDAAYAKAAPAIKKVTEKAAHNIKEEMQADAKGSKHFKRLAPSISYDESPSLRGFAFEVGPDKGRGAPGRAARLANIAYFGGANGGGGTLDIDKPLQNEEPRFTSAISDALRGIL